MSDNITDNNDKTLVSHPTLSMSGELRKDPTSEPSVPEKVKTGELSEQNQEIFEKRGVMRFDRDAMEEVRRQAEEARKSRGSQ